jgi:1,4-alpha-glucan branching enzyme
MNDLAAHDALSDLDLHLLAEGTHLRAYDKLGAHLCTRFGVQGTTFAVWAPNARSVSVVGDFNAWDDAAHPLRLRREAGIWEGFVRGAGQGATYKYSVEHGDGRHRVQKADPFAFHAEVRPRSASVVWDIGGYEWGDGAWVRDRGKRQALDAAITTYEMHLGSWRRGEGERWLTYAELAQQLPAYLSEMGYTHVEFMPVMEHPFDGSWGYQVTSYFAPTSRFGTPQEFMALVDALHQAGIGVILDWVPGHFPTDGHGLALFDGTHLYEHADWRLREHPEWGTFTFNHGRREVRNFLIANALFWLERYHIDGLRVDAVASMLYRDYARKAGQWLPNEHGGREDPGAIAFLRSLNEIVYREHPDSMMIAEESTAWPMVSRPVSGGGLGFGFKWNMGWMHDTLQFMAREPIHRRHHLNDLTFGLLYAYNENFVLPYSHDEVVHGKSSLLGKMPGDDWQRFANLRTLLGYMYGHPGKKLLFMGAELGQWSEWRFEHSLDWHLLQWGPHQGIQRWVRDLNHLVREEPALHEVDFEPGGFEWIDCSDTDNTVVSFVRHDRARKRPLLIVCNFTPVPRDDYRIGAPVATSWTVALNSDAGRYGGSGYPVPTAFAGEHVPTHGRNDSVRLALPPLSTLVLRPHDGATARDVTPT